MNDSPRLAQRSRLSRALVPAACASAVITVAALCAFALQFSTHPYWNDRSATDVLASPLDALVITVVIAGLWAALGRLSWSLAIVSGFALLLAGINYTKIRLRKEPVFPSDRSFVSDSSSLLAMVEWSLVLGVLGSVVGAMLAILLMGRFVGRFFPAARVRHAHGGVNRRFLGARLLTFVLSAGLLVHATHFHQPRNLWRALYDVDANWQPWSQVHNYRSNGFVGGFLSNMPIGAMARPLDYDAETMARISEDYAGRAARINASRDGSLADSNVVFILSESFTDPSWIEGFTLAEDPIPVTRQVMSETIGGTMYAPSYGGGTATMEFESLTGQPVGLFSAQVTSPYPMLVADHAAYPSTVGAFTELGHHTIAIHSYHLDMYKRRQVYRTLGFDMVIDQTGMQSQTRVESSRYVSDAAALDEVLYRLDRHDGPQFISLLTMQNHGPHLGSYSDPIESDAVVSEHPEDYGQYARGLAHSDAGLADFLTSLQSRDEETIVVFYGDHHPGIYNDELLVRNQPHAAFTTPFFVWSSATNQAQAVEAIGPAMFLPLVYEAADAPVPPYVALLDEVRRTVPVLQHARTLDAQGRPIDLDNLDGPTAELIADLRLVQYDFSVGERYAVQAMWPGAVVQRSK